MSSSNICRQLVEVSALQYFHELTFGLYFKLISGSHFFVSSTTVNNHSFKFPMIFCEPETAIQNGGENLIIAPGEVLYVLGEFKLDDGAGIQLKGGKVHHSQALNGEEYKQLLADLRENSSAQSVEIQVWEQTDQSYSLLKKLEFVLNYGGMPYYALELFNSAPDWVKDQMIRYVPELELIDEEKRKRFEGQFWVFRKDIQPYIFEDAYDIIIESVKANVEVFTVRIGVSKMRSYMNLQLLGGVSMAFNGGTIFHPNRDYDLDAPALHVPVEIFVPDEKTDSGKKLLFTFDKYIFDTGCSNTGIHLVTKNKQTDTETITSPPLTHNCYKNQSDGEWYPLNTIGATLSPSNSFTSNGRKKGICMNGKFYVQIIGMTEPVEVKSLGLLENMPDTEDNCVLLGADFIFQHRVSITPDSVKTDVTGGQQIVLDFISLPKKSVSASIVATAADEALNTFSGMTKAAGSAIGTSVTNAIAAFKGKL